MPSIKGRDRNYNVDDRLFSAIGQQLADHGLDDPDGRYAAAVARATIEPEYRDWMTKEALSGNPDLPGELLSTYLAFGDVRQPATPNEPTTAAPSEAPAQDQAQVPPPPGATLAGGGRAAILRGSRPPSSGPQRVPQQNPAGLRALVGSPYLNRGV